MHTRRCPVRSRELTAPQPGVSRGEGSVRADERVHMNAGRPRRERGEANMLDMRVVAAHARDERAPAIDSSRKTSGRFAAVPLSMNQKTPVCAPEEPGLLMFDGLSWQANGLWIDAEVG